MKGDQVSSKCTGCNLEEHWLLNVRHRGIYRRLCSSCILKCHPESFCPNCFEVYCENLPNGLIKCVNCPSIAHPVCVAPELVPRYLCPSCAKPGFSFLDFDSANKKARCGNGESMRWRVLDVSAAKALLAAARIAACSMSRAAAVARIEAEKRVKEAAFARKKAREAIETAISIASKEKERAKEFMDSVTFAEQKKKPKGNTAHEAKKQPQNHAVAEGKEKLGGFDSTFAMRKFQLNIVAAKETDKMTVSEPRPPKNHVVLEGKEKLKVKGPPAPVPVKPQLQNHVTVDEKGKSGLFSASIGGLQRHLQNHAMAEEKEKNRAFLGPTMGQQHVQNRVMGEEKVKLKGFVDSVEMTADPQSHDMLDTLQHINRDGSMVSIPSISGAHVAEISHRLPRSSEDASVSKTNSGIMFTSSPNTASLLS